MAEIHYCDNPYCRDERTRRFLCEECWNVLWHSEVYDEAAYNHVFTNTGPNFLHEFIGKQIRAKGGI